VRRRLVVALAFVALWAGAIAWRLYGLQVVRHEEFVRRAERQQQRVIELDPPRGTIYDARGRELAVSVNVESAFAVPRELKDPRATAQAVAGLLQLDAAKLERALRSDREFVWVARKLDPPLAYALHQRQLPGLYFLEESKRYYPMREVAGALLGYVGTDNRGLAGLEAEFEKVVAGVPGRRTVLRDARQGVAAAPELQISEPKPGRDLYLTLDAVIQSSLETELAKAVSAHRAAGGSAVAIDPQSGAVLAMASFPGFDPNRFTESPSESWRNKPVADAYEPGSTFKLITAAAALEGGLVDPDEVIDCEMGGITLAKTHISDHKRFGLLTFREVIAKSSNVGTIKTALRVANRDFYDAIRGFGFGRTTGVDLPGESPGLLMPVERWGPIAKAYIAFGQGISITPLQLARAFAVVANGGKLLRPYVVAAIGAGHEVERRHLEPEALGRPVSDATLTTLRSLLTSVVTEGTGKNAAVPGYAVAGKTGTAQKAIPGAGYSASDFVASFVGFVPVERPVFLAAIVIDQPRGVYHGGDVAAPVFATVAERALHYLGVAPHREAPEHWPGESPAPPVRPAAPLVVAASANPALPAATIAGGAASSVAMPDLAGLDARRAIASAARLGLRAVLQGQGVVERQEPPAGAPLPDRGAAVQLWLGVGAT